MMLPISMRPRIIAAASPSLGHPRKTSTWQIEVERKFNPVPDFRRKVLAHVELGIADSQACGQFCWSKLPDTIIRDIYYDLDDRLFEAGVWVRYRTIHSLSQETSSILSEVHAQWNAKIRRGGDFINSDFDEMHGEESVRSMLAAKFPDLVMDALKTTADLQTLRSTWSIHQLSASNVLDSQLSVMLDRVEAKQGTNSTNDRFRHEIAEIEAVHEIVEKPDGQALRASQVAKMNSQIDAFVATHGNLIDSSPPVGKLSAFFDWKMRLRNAKSAVAEEE